MGRIGQLGDGVVGLAWNAVCERIEVAPGSSVSGCHSSQRAIECLDADAGFSAGNGFFVAKHQVLVQGAAGSARIIDAGQVKKRVKLGFCESCIHRRHCIASNKKLFLKNLLH